MFSISIKSDTVADRVFFQCPACGTKSVYFVIAPDECEHCKEPLPNYDKMKKNMRARYNYHVYSKN